MSEIQRSGEEILVEVLNAVEATGFETETIKEKLPQFDLEEPEEPPPETQRTHAVTLDELPHVEPLRVLEDMPPLEAVELGPPPVEIKPPTPRGSTYVPPYGSRWIFAFDAKTPDPKVFVVRSGELPGELIDLADEADTGAPYASTIWDFRTGILIEAPGYQPPQKKNAVEVPPGSLWRYRETNEEHCYEVIGPHPDSPGCYLVDSWWLLPGGGTFGTRSIPQPISSNYERLIDDPPWLNREQVPKLYSTATRNEPAEPKSFDRIASELGVTSGDVLEAVSAVLTVVASVLESTAVLASNPIVAALLERAKSPEVVNLLGAMLLPAIRNELKPIRADLEQNSRFDDRTRVLLSEHLRDEHDKRASLQEVPLPQDFFSTLQNELNPIREQIADLQDKTSAFALKQIVRQQQARRREEINEEMRVPEEQQKETRRARENVRSQSKRAEKRLKTAHLPPKVETRGRKPRPPGELTPEELRRIERFLHSGAKFDKGEQRHFRALLLQLEPRHIKTIVRKPPNLFNLLEDITPWSTNERKAFMAWVDRGTG